MNSPNLTTVPLPPAKGRSIGRIRADQPLEACLRKPGAASKLGKIQGPQMRRIHRPLRDGDDMRKLPIERRKIVLAKLLGRTTPPGVVRGRRRRRVQTCMRSRLRCRLFLQMLVAAHHAGHCSSSAIMYGSAIRLRSRKTIPIN